MEGIELENVLCFTYLGSNFEADGDCEQEVKIKMAMYSQIDVWQTDEDLES